MGQGEIACSLIHWIIQLASWFNFFDVWVILWQQLRKSASSQLKWEAIFFQVSIDGTEVLWIIFLNKPTAAFEICLQPVLELALERKLKTIPYIRNNVLYTELQGM